MKTEVRIFKSEMPEDFALALEMVRIAYWRKAGVNLTNRTRGGEKGPIFTAEHRAKIGAASRGRKDSEETKAKKRANALNRSPEHLVKIADALRGRTMTEEQKAKLRAGHVNRPPISEETRAKMKASQQARGPRSDITKARVRASVTAAHARRRLAASLASVEIM